MSEIIDIVCSSESEDEIKSACRLLVENEGQGIEFREQLLDEVEKRQINNKKKKYKLIFDSAELDKRINMRDPLNKKMEEIDADYKYYLSLADRALKLKK